MFTWLKGRNTVLDTYRVGSIGKGGLLTGTAVTTAAVAKSNMFVSAGMISESKRITLKACSNIGVKS